VQVAKRFLIAVFTVFASTGAFARTRIQGYVERGQTLTLGGISYTGPLDSRAQKIYPSCGTNCITIYNTGTLVKPTIYSDLGGTIKQNPFANDSAGYYFFYVDDGDYDIVFAPAGTTPWQLTAVRALTGNGLAFFKITDFGGSPPTGELIAIGNGAAAVYTNNSYGSIFIGLNSGALANGSDNDVCIGPVTCTAMTTNGNQVGIGSNALRFATGANNTAVGSSAGSNVSTGSLNVYVGSSTGQNNTTGQSNTIVGQAAFSGDVTGSNDTAVGRFSMNEENGGTNNTGIGVESCHGQIHANQVVDGTFPNSTNWKTNGNWTIASSKAQKTVDGTGALIPETGGTTPYIDYGVGSFFFVSYTVGDYTAGTVQVCFGGVCDVARSSNGSFTFTAIPTAYGPGLTEANTLQFQPSNTSRLSISAVSLTGISNANFSGNTCLGVGALYQLIQAGAGTGQNNVAIGVGSARQHTSGNDDVSVGVSALNNNGTGNQNTAVGNSAAYTCVTCSGQVAVGFQSGYYSTESNVFYVDNAQRASESAEKTLALLYGHFGAGVANQDLAINAAAVAIGGQAIRGGTALLVGAGGTTNAIQKVVIDGGSAAGGDAVTEYQLNGAHKAYVGVASASNRIITGDVVGDTDITSTTNVNLSADNGTSIALKVLGAVSGEVTLKGIAFASLGTPANGTIAYCSDCNSTCTAGASTGQMCWRINGAWTH
jgi:hypothetical protein